MTEENKTLNDNFQYNNNKPAKIKNLMKITRSILAIDLSSSLHNLEYTVNLKRKIEYITQYLKPYTSKTM